MIELSSKGVTTARAWDISIRNVSHQTFQFVENAVKTIERIHVIHYLGNVLIVLNMAPHQLIMQLLILNVHK